MRNNKPILIIENQKTQYIRIVENMNGYMCYPSQDEYLMLIDCIRIWINKQYDSSYRDKAWVVINEYIENREIKLIIMDNILGGAHHCLTGVDVAFKFNGDRLKNGKPIVPILYMSKTEHNELSRINAHTEYEKAYPGTSRWLYKGYFGNEILEPVLFKNKVVPLIRELIGKTEKERFLDDLEIVLHLAFPSMHAEKQRLLFRLKELDYEYHSQELIRMIQQVATSRDVNAIKYELLRP